MCKNYPDSFNDPGVGIVKHINCRYGPSEHVATALYSALSAIHALYLTQSDWGR